MEKAIYITALISFALGGGITGKAVYDYKERQALTLAAQASQAQIETQKRVREIEHDYERKLADAIAERDKAVALADARLANADRLRKRSDSLASQLERLSATSGNSGNADSIRAGKCEQLLAEATGLLGEGERLAVEGGNLLERIEANRNALSKLVDSVR
jgi:hypothetical protein